MLFSCQVSETQGYSTNLTWLFSREQLFSVTRQLWLSHRNLFSSLLLTFDEMFSSTILHQVKKKSQPWRGLGYPVLISVDFNDWNSLFKNISNTRDIIFMGYPNNWNFVNNTSARRNFNSLFGVSISRWITVSYMWYIQGAAHISNST